MTEIGHISIDTDNILPIIKKWLYAEKDIYLRELVANASDAITKLQKIALEEDGVEAPEAKIEIEVDKKAKTLTITDSGVGLTAEEVRKYINQIAFSGVKDFVEKYQGKDEQNQIIGHFGLGFYSAFMVAHTVEIDSLSYQAGAEPVRWSCKGDTEFTLSTSDRKKVGTSIILHVADDSQEMLDAFKISALIDRYCAFIRYPIEMNGKAANDPNPIWTKSPSQLSDDDYKAFYQKLFPMSPEPLFWVHLNLDYPFNLRGVLFFPKFSHEFEAAEGQVKLYCNQVFVADNCKELVPEYLTVLKGVLDVPDLPLNVSRSYLQSDPHVRKISEHITKKVADKLVGMAKTERDEFLKFWGDIHSFVKYCMMRDDKFSERMQEHLLYKDERGEFITLEEYLKRADGKTDHKVIYVSDAINQSTLVEMMKEQSLPVVYADAPIDKHFLPFLEAKTSKKYNFQRIDADLSTHLKDDKAGAEIVDAHQQKTKSERIQDLFERLLKVEGLKIEVSRLKSQKIPAMLMIDESGRRMQEMAKFMPFGDLGGAIKAPEKKLLVNSSCAAVDHLLKLSEGIKSEDDLAMMARQIYDLAVLQHGDFGAEAMQGFINRSVELLSRVQ